MPKLMEAQAAVLMQGLTSSPCPFSRESFMVTKNFVCAIALAISLITPQAILAGQPEAEAAMIAMAAQKTAALNAKEGANTDLGNAVGYYNQIIDLFNTHGDAIWAESPEDWDAIASLIVYADARITSATTYYGTCTSYYGLAQVCESDASTAWDNMNYTLCESKANDATGIYVPAETWGIYSSDKSANAITYCGYAEDIIMWHLGP